MEQFDLPSRSNQACLHGDKLIRGRDSHIYLRSQNRTLTNRERARLQNFHDDFEFHDSKESVRKLIGMAVPPNGANIICEAILNTFTDIPYDTAAPSLAHLVPKKLSAAVRRYTKLNGVGAQLRKRVNISGRSPPWSAASRPAISRVGTACRWHSAIQLRALCRAG